MDWTLAAVIWPIAATALVLVAALSFWPRVQKAIGVPRERKSRRKGDTANRTHDDEKHPE